MSIDVIGEVLLQLLQKFVENCYQQTYKFLFSIN